MTAKELGNILIGFGEKPIYLCITDHQKNESLVELDADVYQSSVTTSGKTIQAVVLDAGTIETI